MIKSIVQLVTFVAGVAAVTPEIEGTEGMVSTDLARQLELFSTLKKRDRIIASANARYLKTTHKFGIRIPKTVLEAIEIDRENGNTM